MKYWIPAPVAANPSTELILRTFGFGNPALSQTDTESPRNYLSLNGTTKIIGSKAHHELNQNAPRHLVILH